MDKGVAFEFFRIFWSNSPPLGLQNCSNPITYPFLHLRKLQFGAKFEVKIPRTGTKEVFKCCTYAVPPISVKIYLYLHHRAAVVEPGGDWYPTFALG